MERKAGWKLQGETDDIVCVLGQALFHVVFVHWHQVPFQGLVDDAGISDYLQTSPQAWRN